MESHQTETRRIDKHTMASLISGKPMDFQKLLEELKALKARSYTLDLQRLEESQKVELEAAMKAAEKRVKGGVELLKAQAEERRIAESKHVRDKELLTAKFQKLDQTLSGLGLFLGSITPVKEMEAKLAEREAALRKQEDELNVQRKVFAREKDELESERNQLRASEQKVNEQLRNLDVTARAIELDQLREDLDTKLQAYMDGQGALEKQREELNRDFDKLGEARAEVDRVVEQLEAEREGLKKQKADMADAVARDMARTFEGLIRDLLTERAAEEAAKPKPKLPPPPKKPNIWGDLPE